MLSFSEQASIVSGELPGVNEMLQKLRAFGVIPFPCPTVLEMACFQGRHVEFHADLWEMR
jgi:hypothetical protein